MGPAKPQISDAERDVLKTLWELETATVRQLRKHLAERGRRWAHTTISTLLSRMVEKDLVARDTSGFAHVFSAIVSREALVQQHLSDLADAYCGGQSAPLVLALVEGKEFTETEIKQFRVLIDQLANADLDHRSASKPARKRTRN